MLGTIIWSLALIACVAGLVISIRMLLRNNKVFSFKLLLSELAYEYEMRHLLEQTGISAYEWFANKYSYEDMMWSFKKLRLEDWYTEEEIYKIHH